MCRRQMSHMQMTDVHAQMSDVQMCEIKFTVDDSHRKVKVFGSSLYSSWIRAHWKEVVLVV